MNFTREPFTRDLQTDLTAKCSTEPNELNCATGLHIVKYIGDPKPPKTRILQKLQKLPPELEVGELDTLVGVSSREKRLISLIKL